MSGSLWPPGPPLCGKVMMQRVRIGITGLACVFLVVLLAAAIVGFRSEDGVSTTDGNGVAVASGGNAAGAEEPKDPLAELGVAPGGAMTDSKQAAPAAR